MQVSLRLLLIAAGISAVLIAAWTLNPVLAGFTLSTLPVIAFAAYRKKLRKGLIRIPLFFAALLPFYLASYGPSFLLNSYVMYTDPPATKAEIDNYNEWVRLQAALFAPMYFGRNSPSFLSRLRYEYIGGWMELSDDTMAYLVGYEDDTGQT